MKLTLIPGFRQEFVTGPEASLDGASARRGEDADGFAFVGRCGFWSLISGCALAYPRTNACLSSILIEIEDKALRGLKLTEAQALLDLTIGMFTERRGTLGRATEIARLTQAEFQRELGRRGIPIHYDVYDLRADLRTLESLRQI
jgi:predicted HTH domain antitoxin